MRWNCCRGDYSDSQVGGAATAALWGYIEKLRRYDNANVRR
jgi:hypothetical protein